MPILRISFILFRSFIIKVDRIDGKVKIFGFPDAFKFVALSEMPKRNTARALWHTDSHHSEIREEMLHPTKDEMEHFTTTHSLISIGTERLVAMGKVPDVIASEMAVPRMEGQFSLPVKYGYSICGYLTKEPDTFYHLMHPHQTALYVVPEQLTPLPDGVPPDRGTLASNMETVINAVWDGQPLLGERCLVMGFGLIGALLANLLDKYGGVDLWVKESDPERRNKAADMGYQIWKKDDIEFDLIYNASGEAEAWNEVFSYTGIESRLIELSWTGLSTSNLDLGEHFHTNRLQLRSSQVSHIPSAQTGRWDFNRRKSLVMQLLRDPWLDALLTDRIPFDETPALFDDIRAGRTEGLGYLITYN